MIVITGHFVLSAPVSAEMRKAAADMMKASNAEAGCNHYAFAEDLSNPNILWVTEEWTDDAALKAHFQAPHMAAFQKVMATLTIQSRGIKRYEIASSAPM